MISPTELSEIKELHRLDKLLWVDGLALPDNRSHAYLAAKYAGIDVRGMLLAEIERLQNQSYYVQCPCCGEEYSCDQLIDAGEKAKVGK